MPPRAGEGSAESAAKDDLGPRERPLVHQLETDLRTHLHRESELGDQLAALFRHHQQGEGG
jgi:hypothetical protein